MSKELIIIYALMIHLVMDYLAQNDWMALNKKQRSWPCLIHSLAYCIPFAFILPAWCAIAIGIQHFTQDRTNIVLWFMKWKGSGKFATGPCSPWSIIITDNIMHFLFIIIIIEVIK